MSRPDPRIRPAEGGGTGSGIGGRRHVLGGTAWGFAAEALAVPTGIATVAFLTRALGAADYGLYSLAAALVFALQGAINSLLARATVRFVARADDWRPAAATTLRLYVALGFLTAAALWVAAPWVGALLDSPALPRYLRIFSVDIPIAAIAHAHVHIMVGLGLYRMRAVVRTARWIGRLVLIVGLVAAGFGIAGAVMGSVGATALEILVARRRLRPPLRGVGAVPVRPLLVFAAPLFVGGTATAVAQRIDLLGLKALGGTEAEAGFYAAAQNVALLPMLLAAAFTPLLIASAAHALEHGRRDEALRIGEDFARVGLGMLPFAALAAATAGEIMSLLYGPPFVAGARPLALLLFAGTALVMIAVVTGLLTALDRPGWAAAVTVAQLVAGALLLPLLIPRWSAVGAAAATLAGGAVGVAVGAFIVRRFLPLRWPPASVARALVVSVLAYAAAYAWHASGFLVLLEIAVIGAGIVAALLLTGEITRAEADAARRFLRRELGG